MYFHHVRRLLTIDLMRAIMDFYGCPAIQILHTHAAFTGGCNFTLGCERFLASCGACPELSSTDEHDLSRGQWLHKRDVLGRHRWPSSRRRRTPPSWPAEAACSAGTRSSRSLTPSTLASSISAIESLQEALFASPRMRA